MAQVSYIGWWVGLAVTAVVVVLVAATIYLARRIRDQAETVVQALDSVRERTTGLWDVQQTNAVAKGILEAARKARAALGG